MGFREPTAATRFDCWVRSKGRWLLGSRRVESVESEWGLAAGAKVLTVRPVAAMDRSQPGMMVRPWNFCINKKGLAPGLARDPDPKYQNGLFGLPEISEIVKEQKKEEKHI